MRALISASAIALLASPALAGDFTGPYAGAQIGYADFSTSTGLSGDRFSFGLHGGYDFDYGDWILGGEFEWDRLNLTTDTGNVKANNIGRVKLKVGYDFGTAYGYVVVGAATIKTNIGSESSGVAGLGLNFQTGYDFDTSVEILRHDFSSLGSSGVGADATTANIRFSFNF